MPTNTLNAEHAVLGAALLDSAARDAVCENLDEIDFEKDRERTVFHAVSATGERVDLLTVTDALRQAGRLERIGGATFLSSLVDALPDVANVESYVEIIKRQAQEREERRALVALNANPRDRGARAALARLLSAPDPTTTREAEGFMLRDLIDRPELTAPPQAIVPGFLYVDRLTLLAAREKAGKSTLMGWLASLGSHHDRILWLGLEEPLGDAVRRFKTFGANPDRIMLLDRLTTGHAGAFEIVRSFDPAVIFLDSLAKWGEGVITDWNASAQVTPLMTKLSEMCHHEHRAMMTSHHAKKSDGTYRDSTAIGANADLILEMHIGDADPNVRRFNARGRMTVDDFALRFNGTDYDSVGGSISIRDRVLAFVEANPDSSKRKIRDGVHGDNTLIDRSLGQLETDGLISNKGGEKCSKMRVTENGTSTVAARCAARCGDHGGIQWSKAPARSQHGIQHGCVLPTLRGIGSSTVSEAAHQTESTAHV